jgi:hypothetical protein
MSAYSDDEKDAILELRSFMLNEVTEPAMTLLKRIFQRSCPFTYNIEYAVNNSVFMIIKNADNSTMDPLPEELIWAFERSCDGDILAFPVNCFEDVPNVKPVREMPDGFGHANLVIVNRLLQTVEHFDPHGSKMNDLMQAQQSKFEAAVQKLFLKGPWAHYTYLPPSKVCPTEGVQNLLIDHGDEDRIKSTCRIWCYHFLASRLEQPGLPASEINRQNLDKLQSGASADLGKRVDGFIMNFILDLYKAINVRFEHTDNEVCLRWPQESKTSEPSYCVSKKKTNSRRRGSQRKISVRRGSGRRRR